MLAYATLEKADCVKVEGQSRPVQLYRVRVVASHHADWPVGFKSNMHTRQAARDYCKAYGLELTLPPMYHVQATTAEKEPYFFTSGTRRFHDRQPRAHALKICRLADGNIGVTNGRSTWLYTGNSLDYIA